jgi:hypothetical protein
MAPSKKRTTKKAAAKKPAKRKAAAKRTTKAAAKRAPRRPELGVADATDAPRPEAQHAARDALDAAVAAEVVTPTEAAALAEGTASPVERTFAANLATKPEREPGERLRVGDHVVFRTAHPTGAQLVEQYGQVVELDTADNEPAACVAWVDGGVSGPIATAELAKLG